MGYKRVSWRQVPHKKKRILDIEDVIEQPVSKPKKRKDNKSPQTSDVDKGSDDK